MGRFGSARAFAVVGVLSCSALANGCGGGSGTISGPNGDAGDATAAQGASSSGSGIFDATNEATSSSGGGSSGADSSSGSSSSGGGGDSGSDSSGDSSGSSGGEDSGADSGSSSSGGSGSGADSSSDSSGSGGGLDSGTDSSSGSSSSGGGDSGSDATTEAGPPCSPNGSACALGSVSGLCVGGACSACTAAGPTGPSSNCSVAYGDTGASGYVCSASGSCVPGDCVSDTDCSGGICGLARANFCAGCTTDAQCQADTHYGAATICDTGNHTCVSSSCTTVGTVCPNPADICCGAAPACTPGNCCSNAQCQATAATPACNPATSTCAACDALGASATVVVVDPLNGVDVPTNGSGTVGGQANGICGFRTIRYALTHLTASTTTVNVLPTGPVSVAGNGEAFPINVTEANITISGSTGTPIVNDIGTGTTTTGIAFMVTGAGARLSKLIIDGGVVNGSSVTPTATHGIVIGNGSTLSTSISDVEVRNFAGAGIRVESTGTVTIGPGTNAHGNGIGGPGALSGLYVTGSGLAVIAGDAGGAPIAFNGNGQSGILVDSAGSVRITGNGAGGSVQAEQNTLDGLEIHQDAASPPLSTITGFLAASNAHDGARLYAASAVTVRGSVFIGNGDNGIQIEPTTSAGTVAGNNDISSINLGTAAAGGDAGGNELQDTTSPNNAAGVCISLAQEVAQVLPAQGNQWVSAALPAGDVDCTLTAAALTEGAAASVGGGRACAGAVDIGGSGLGGAAAKNGVSVNGCTCAGGMTCQ